MSKLTLSIDKEIIEKARELALEHQTSISEMFSSFINTVSSKNKNQKLKLTPLTKRASGIAKMEANVDYKDVVFDAMAEKYGYGK